MAKAQKEPWRVTFGEMKASIDEIVEEARNGRMFILVDDEDRENEGDLVIPAQMATPDAINFMAKHGRGLICLALEADRAEELRLPRMERRNESRHSTAFTVSIEARHGVTTGISAPDRARTVAVAIDPSAGPDDLTMPGHIFPVVARDGGVLMRTGHTEAAVDLARMAGLYPAGVICEIMNDDGTMARRDDLIGFAQRHGLKIATIADLIAYRLRHDHVVERQTLGSFESRHGGHFEMAIYSSTVTGTEHIALWKGEIDDSAPVLVRVHALSVLDDVLGDLTSGRGGELQEAMRVISEAGRGVVVLIRESMMATLVREVAARESHSQPPMGELRDYGLGAQILLDLGVRDMILLHNTRHTFVGLDGYGLKVVGQQPIKAEGSDGEGSEA